MAYGLQLLFLSFELLFFDQSLLPDFDNFSNNSILTSLYATCWSYFSVDLIKPVISPKTLSSCIFLVYMFCKYIFFELAVGPPQTSYTHDSIARAFLCLNPALVPGLCQRLNIIIKINVRHFLRPQHPLQRILHRYFKTFILRQQPV